MSLSSAIHLVKSLSGPEKRYFKLHTREQSGDKDYLLLFDMIDQAKTVDTAALQQRFRSVDNTARYLVKVLTDCLVQLKAEKDPQLRLLQDIMRANVLRERALPEEAYRQTKKVQQAARDSQQHLIEYLTYRDELNYLSDTGFQGITDKTLVETQMAAKAVLRKLHLVQEHHTLFELLKYRLVHAGKASSDDDKRRMNDLMLSEMTLITGRSGKSFAAQKLHLLFQSFFFINIGDYQSALKTFHTLNHLFEKNFALLDHPPLDYLSALNGILDSLHALKDYETIGFYTEKAKQLDQPVYQEHFRYQVRKTIAVYQLAVLTGQQHYQQAADHLATLENGLLAAYQMINEERQWELYFYHSLACFGNRQWKKAHRYIREVMQQHRSQSQWMICKATRLLNMMLYYEQGDMDYIGYEIQAYKRSFGKNRLLQTEILLLKLLQNGGKRLPAGHLKKLQQTLLTLQEDRYERQLLKYFDFAGWIAQKSVVHF